MAVRSLYDTSTSICIVPLLVFVCVFITRLLHSRHIPLPCLFVDSTGYGFPAEPECVHAQGASGVHAAEPKLTVPQSDSVPAPVTWASFKSLAKPGDRLRLIGGALHTSEGALAVPGDALSAAQQSPAGSSALGGDASLSSAQGFVLPAGSDVPLVTDTDVGRWAVSLASENLSPTADQHQAALKDRGYVEAAGREAEGMVDEIEGLLTVRSQADRLMLLAQVGLPVYLSVCIYAAKLFIGACICLYHLYPTVYWQTCKH